jgi:hypothetical protein
LKISLRGREEVEVEEGMETGPIRMVILWSSNVGLRK